MKRALFLCIVFLAGLISCGGGSQGGTGKPATTPQIIEEGWLSDTQFRVKVSAETDITSGDSDTFKKSSENAALKKAKETVVRNFVTIRVKQSPSAGSYAVAALAIDREFRDTIENGKVITRQFEAGDRKCTIVYQVERKDLKKSVETGSR